MVNKGWISLGLLGVLLFIVIFVQVYIDNSLDTISKKLEILDVSISENSENIDNNKTNECFEELNNYWNSRLSMLCIMIDYNEISPIGDSIAKIKGGIEGNDYVSSNVELKYLIELVDALKKIYKIRLQNIL